MVVYFSYGPRTLIVNCCTSGGLTYTTTVRTHIPSLFSKKALLKSFVCTSFLTKTTWLYKNDFGFSNPSKLVKHSFLPQSVVDHFFCHKQFLNEENWTPLPKLPLVDSLTWCVEMSSWPKKLRCMVASQRATITAYNAYNQPTICLLDTYRGRNMKWSWMKISTHRSLFIGLFCSFQIYLTVIFFLFLKFCVQTTKNISLARAG